MTQRFLVRETNYKVLRRLPAFDKRQGFASTQLYKLIQDGRLEVEGGGAARESMRCGNTFLHTHLSP